jgi:hypothetical protein
MKASTTLPSRPSTAPRIVPSRTKPHFFEHARRCCVRRKDERLKPAHAALGERIVDRHARGTGRDAATPVRAAKPVPKLGDATALELVREDADAAGKHTVDNDDVVVGGILPGRRCGPAARIVFRVRKGEPPAEPARDRTVVRDLHKTFGIIIAVRAQRAHDVLFSAMATQGACGDGRTAARPASDAFDPGASGYDAWH